MGILRTRRGRVLAWAAGLMLAVVTLWAVAASFEDPDLAALRADPMASWVPAGAALESAHDSESGTTLGKPVYARVTRVFTLARGSTPQAALDAAARDANRHGWVVVTRRDDSVRATKTEGGRRLELLVVNAAVPGVEGELFVYLSVP